MEKVLIGILLLHCLVYLDDLLVHRSTISEALLCEVLQWLEVTGLKLRPDKCRFMQ